MFVLPSVSMSPSFILTHLCEVQRLKCTKTCHSLGLRKREKIKAMRGVTGKGLIGGRHLIVIGLARRQLKSLCGKNDSSLTLDLPMGSEKPRNAGTLQRYHGYFRSEF